MFYSLIFFYACAFFCFAGVLLYAVYIAKKEALFFGYSRQWLAVGLISGVFSAFLRFRALAHLPMVTLFEITFFYALLLIAAYILFIKAGMPEFTRGLALFISCGMVFTCLFLDKKAYPLNPLLKSFWLGIHVPAVMLSYSAFAISLALSLYYVIARSRGKEAGHLDGLNSGLILAGVILLGVGILTGSIWARSAWGRYWSWDAKETWALITFVIYACAALIRKVFVKKPLWQAVFSIAGFAAMLFTFFGVSLLLSSHHAYR